MCCLFGLIDYGHHLTGREKTRMLSVLAAACEVRGTDATGIAYNLRGGSADLQAAPARPPHALPDSGRGMGRHGPHPDDHPGQ